MKKYTIEQLNGMLLEEIKKVAKNEFGLALSEKGKRFTKGQLIVKITSLITNEEIKEEESKSQKANPLKVRLDVNNTHSIVAQARQLLDKSVKNAKVVRSNKTLLSNIKHVEESKELLRMQVVKGQLKGFKRTQANNAISLLSIMVKSYESKAQNFNMPMLGN